MSDPFILLKIFRFDPDIQSAPTYQTYPVPWREGLILLAAIKYVRDHLDETLAFRDYCCGCGWCTSCLMTVDGQGMRTCSRLLKPGESLVIEPMRGFPVIKDLVVDFGITMTTAEGVFKKMEGTVLRKEKST
jgi:succinate dehydrogenase/fumarate reductase-like Fe-S protein